MANIVSRPEQGLIVRRGHPTQPANSFRGLRNADLYAAGITSKRRDFDALSNDALSGADLPDTLKGVGTRADELLRIQGNDLYSHVEPADAWVRRGPWLPSIASETTRLSTGRSFDAADWAELDGFRVILARETVVLATGDATIYWSVQTLDGTTIVPATPLVTSAGITSAQPRVIAVGTWVAVTYYDATGGNVVLHSWSPSTPTVLAAGPVLRPSERGYSLFAALPENELWLIRVGTGGAGTGAARDRISGDLSVLSSDAIAPVTTVTAISVTRSGTEPVFAWLSTATTVRYLWATAALATISTGLSTIFTAALRLDIVAVSGEIGGQPVALALIEDNSGAALDTDRRIRRQSFTRTGTVVVAAAFQRALSLMSRQLALAEDLQSLALAVYPDGVDAQFSASTYVWIRVWAPNEGDIYEYKATGIDFVGRAYPNGQASTFHGRFAPEELSLITTQVTGDGVAVPCMVRTVFGVLDDGAVGNRPFSGEMVGDARLDFANARSTTADTALYAVWALGGFLSAYDGRYAFEADFHTPPVIDNIVAIGSGDPLPAGTYVWAMTYDFRSQDGAVWRSVVVTRSFAVPAASAARLTLRTLRVTQKQDADVLLSVWRTRINESGPFFFVGSKIDPIVNDSSVNSLLFTDQAPDATIENNEVLELAPAGPLAANEIVQATAFCTVAGDRVWFRDTAAPFRIGCTKLFVDNTGLEMNTALFVDLDTQETAQGVGVQDGTYYGFGRNRISPWSGRGPDNALNGQPVSEPVEIPPAEGLNRVAAVASTSLGLAYSTGDGPAVVGRDQSAQSPFDAITELYRFSGADVRALVYDPRDAEVWFFDTQETEDLGTIHFSTRTNRHSQHTLLAANEATITRSGTLLVGRTDGRVLVRRPSTLTRGLTAGNATPLVHTTAWQTPVGRLTAPYSLESATLALLYRSAHRLVISAYLDYDPQTVRGLIVVDATRDGLQVIEAYGDAVFDWGAEATWGEAQSAPGLAYLVHIQMARNPTLAVSFAFHDAPADGPGYELVELQTNWAPQTAVDQNGVTADARKYTLRTT
jgi:hypothetical protein